MDMDDRDILNDEDFPEAAARAYETWTAVQMARDNADSWYSAANTEADVTMEDSDLMEDTDPQSADQLQTGVHAAPSKRRTPDDTCGLPSDENCMSLNVHPPPQKVPRRA